MAGIGARLGVQKLRLTGGEPLLRRDLERLVAMLAAIDGIDDVAMTTNGSLLARKARALADAGLGRVTVSLDSLDDAVFGAVNDVDFPVERVLEGIAAAREAGLPVKVNMVVKRGLNDGSVLDMAGHFRGTGHVLRLIEYMDVGTTNGWQMDDVVPASELIETIDAQWPVEPVDPAYPGEVARRYRYRDGAGEIGVIASVTQPFCHDCSRARLSAEGRLYTCLFAAVGHDLRGGFATTPATRTSRRSCAASGAGAPTATPSCARPRRRSGRRSRCRTSAARRPVRGPSRPRVSLRCGLPWTLRRPLRAPAGAFRNGCPRGGVTSSCSWRCSRSSTCCTS